MEKMSSHHIRLLVIDGSHSPGGLYRQSLPYECVLCQSRDQAVQLVKNSVREGLPFAIACIESRMFSESELIRIAEQIRTVDPQIELVIVTETAQSALNEMTTRILPEGKIWFLAHPFEPQLMSTLLETLGTRWRAERELHSVRQDLQNVLDDCKQDRGRLQQLEKAVEMMQLGIIMADLDGNMIYTNPAMAEMHGYQTKELLGQKLVFLVAPELRKSPSLERLNSWNGLIRESVHLRKDGTTFPVWLMSEIVQNTKGEPWVIVTSCENITERKRAEEELQDHRHRLEELVEERTSELRQANEQLQCEILEHTRTTEALQKSEERYRTVLEAAPDPVVVYDMQERVTYLNPAFSRVFGWTLEENLGQSIDFVPIEQLAESRLMLTKIHRGKTVSGIETRRIINNGTYIDVSISGAGFFDSHGTLQGSVFTIQDISERKKTEEEIRFIAYHDALTGLHNRKSFYVRLEDKLLQVHSSDKEMRRSGDKWAILFLDLDNFKSVNDTLGHDVGDELLKLVAERLQKCIRKSDYLFRLGGDEFTILLNALSDDTSVAKIARHIREKISRPLTVKQHELFMSVSIGISLYPDDGEDVETLVRNADMAMYAAKDESEGYRFFTEEMNQKALERMRLESSLRIALQQAQFIVHYQPLIDHDKQIAGMEALVRWRHPELGLINPSRFIPLAEETGIIVPLGKWVLYTACHQTKTWHDMGHTELYVSVNLSARQFKEPDLIETIEQVLEATQLPPTCLKLEVTESGIMENPEYAVKIMHHLRAKGIQFSIDDFGTGYSSLSYLKRFPVDTLKIDRSFVLDSIHNKHDREIIKTIISMAKMLNLETIAEGVETEEQHEFLLDQGCEMMQGFFLGWPVPADQFGEVLQKKKMSDSEPDES